MVHLVVTARAVWGPNGPVEIRVGVAIAAGVATAALFRQEGLRSYSPAAGWIAAAAVYLIWTLAMVLPMDGERTRLHATRLGGHQNAVGKLAHAALFTASLASLLGVADLLHAETAGDLAAAVVGALSVSMSWLVIHTIFTLRYALLFYGSPDWQTRPRIDFNEDEFAPAYYDFAYLAFGIGMSYSVSDTALRGTLTRRAVLFQALVSFGLGAVIIAIALNLVASLAG